MNILITGCNGYLGNELKSIKNHNLFLTDRTKLELLNFNSVKTFIRENKIEGILHCAIKGGRRNRQDSARDCYDNTLMFENLIANIDEIKIFINYDSAASYNRTTGIDGFDETQFPQSVPNDFYGFAKYIIVNRVKSIDKAYNLRIFNCFGKDETQERMMKSNIYRYINREPIVIHTNKKMDFFYIDDLITITQYYLDNFDKKLVKDLNLCYKEKTTLLDIANMINDLGPYRVPISIEKETVDFNYFGNSKYLHDLPIGLKGMEYGIKHMYNFFKGEK